MSVVKKIKEKKEANDTCKGKNKDIQIEIFECKECEKQFKNKQSQSNHMSKFHSTNTIKKQEFYCNACNIQVSSKSNLSRHQKTCKEYCDVARLQKNIHELETQTKCSQLQIEMLQTQLADHKTQLSNLTKQNSDLSKQNLDLSKQNVDLTKQNNQRVDEIISSKDKLFEVSNKAHQIQNTMMHQVNSNNQYNVIVHSHTDIELAKHLTPISKDNLAQACINALDNYIDSRQIEVYKPEMFCSDIIHSQQLQNSIIKTDTSRNITSWVSKDDNNQLVKDKNARQLLLKMAEIPKENKQVHKKIDEIVVFNSSLSSKINLLDKEVGTKYFDDVKESNEFFKHIQGRKKIPERLLKKYEKFLHESIPDRSEHILKLKQSVDEKISKDSLLSFAIDDLKCKIGEDTFNHLLEVFHIIEKQLTTTVKEDDLYSDLYCMMLIFYNIEESASLFRKLLQEFYRECSKMPIIRIEKEKVEDRIEYKSFIMDPEKEQQVEITKQDCLTLGKIFFRSLVHPSFDSTTLTESKASQSKDVYETHSLEQKVRNYIMKKEWCYSQCKYFSPERLIELDNLYIDAFIKSF